MTRTFVQAGDGTPLFVRVFEAAERNAPTLLMVHGACEHGERYRHVAEEFVRAGWRVIVPDLRGHGRSGGTPMYVQHFDDYVADLDALHTQLELNPKRTGMLGHSMGGLVSVRYAQTLPHRLAALVLSSPLFRVKVPIPRTTLALGRIISAVAPRFRFRSHVSAADVTKDVGSQQSRKTDPYIHRSVTAGWFFSMKRAMRDAWRQAAKVNTPVLIVQAGDDRIVDPAASNSWFDSLPGAQHRLHVVPGGYHELFNELDWKQTVGMIVEWLGEFIPAAKPEVGA